MKQKRGYPVAVLAGLEEKSTVIWKIFSNAARHEKTIPLNGSRNDPKALYNFHEATINALRPTLKEGVKSVILASPPKTDYAKTFLAHIQQHHTWLNQGPNKTAFSEITGSAHSRSNIATLARTPLFREQIDKTAQEENETLIELLERRLNTADQQTLVFYAIEEIENLILKPHKPGKPQPEYLALTDKYLSTTHQKNRLNRLIQVAQNKKVKTRILNAESPAGKRITQLGGIIALANTD